MAATSDMAPVSRGSNPHRSSNKSDNSASSSSPITVGGGVMIGHKPSVIARGSMRFLVMDAPRQSNLYLYIRECRKHGVTDLVRVCEPTYDGEVDLNNAGIELHEMEYPDGTSPSKEVLERWLDLVHRRYFRSSSGSNSNNKPTANGGSDGKGEENGLVSSSSNSSTTNGGTFVSSVTPVPKKGDRTIGVHCVAGLGRAPVLVAIALVEFAAMDPVEAVIFIRRHRRGAINGKQLNYLEKYKRQWKGGGTDVCCNCVIM